MLMNEWPEEAIEVMKENKAINKEMLEMISKIDSIENLPARNEIIDRFYFLNVRFSFNLGKSIDILKNSLEKIGLSECYKIELGKDIEWLKGLYSSNSQSVKNLFNIIQMYKYTNSPEG